MLKPYYENKYGVLYHGDCLEIMPQLDVKFDMVLTDPPYGCTDCKWDIIIPFEDMWQNIKRLRNDNIAVALFGSEPFSSQLRISNLKEFKYDWIYEKSRATNFLNSKKQPQRTHEIVSVFYKQQCTYNPQMRIGKPYETIKGNSRESVSKDPKIQKGGYKTINHGTRYPVSVLNFVCGNDTVHPTQKPTPFIEYLVKTYTNENNLVLDFCAGSGTTGVACIKTNRRFVMIEKEEKYFEICVKRLEQALYEVSLLR